MYWLLALAAVCSAGKAVVCKRLGMNDKNSRSVFAWNSGIYLVAAVLSFLSMYPNFGAVFQVSGFSFIWAFLFAAFLLFTQITEIKAMALGSVSMTLLIFSGGFLLPIGYGYFCLGESVSLLRCCGIVLMIISMSFIIRPRKEGEVSWRWVCMSLLAMVGSGSVAITQKFHQSTVHADELQSFVTLGLLFASLFSFIVARIKQPRGQKPPALTLRDIEFVAISGLCIGALNMLNLFLAGKLPAAVQFPVYNIGSMLLTAMFSLFVLKERYTRSQKLGFVLGCISILLLGL